jgi:hypothetical protein
MGFVTPKSRLTDKLTELTRTNRDDYVTNLVTAE